MGRCTLSFKAVPLHFQNGSMCGDRGREGGAPSLVTVPEEEGRKNRLRHEWGCLWVVQDPCLSALEGLCPAGQAKMWASKQPVVLLLRF